MDQGAPTDNPPMKTTYDDLCRSWLQLSHLGHLQAMASWDQAAMMPAGANPARAAAMAEMDGLLHRIRTDASLADRFARAADDDIDAFERANLEAMRREWRAATALPAALVEAKSLAGARCEHAWRTQRPANDWTGYLGNFREVLRLGREEARWRAEATGLGLYDALLDQYEPGTTSADIDRVFGDLQQWLPGLVAKARERQSRESVIPADGPFPKAAQRALSLAVMARLGFDFNAGRLDESAHPFSGGVPQDVRITTRYREDSLLPSLMGTIHETGHARYEQGLPRDWLGQPVGLARSMAIHESQSLAFEMQLGRSRAFVGLLAPLLAEHIGEQPAFEADNLHRLMTRVRPGFIRVDADEATYPAHVILRYGIERRLIEGDVEADDLPGLWDDGMQSLLGIDTRGNYRDGCLQDVHWTGGSFGYFPTYTLGAMYAAQWFATIRQRYPDLDQRIAAGDLGQVFDWLREHIWSQASRWPTADLAVRATGSPLDPAHFRRHLESRYLG